MSSNGYKKASTVEITVDASAGTVYCVTATHSLLTVANEWDTAVYNSSDGSPVPSNVDNC